MFNIVALLPQFMIIGEDVIACIEGDCTQEEWNKTVDDFFKMCVSIPQVQGVLGIIEIVSMVTKVAFPLVDGVINTKATVNTPKLKMAKKNLKKSVSSNDVAKAQRSMKFFNEVTAKVAAHNGLKNNSPETDVNWTADFFEEYK